jgi:ABC-type methionine transport system permease subunit
MNARKERIKYEKMSKNYDRIYSVSFILLIILVCSSVIIIGATVGKYGVFLLLAILLNARITKESKKKYEHYSNKGRI